MIWADQPQVYLETLQEIQNKYFLFFLYYRWPDDVTIRISGLRDKF